MFTKRRFPRLVVIALVLFSAGATITAQEPDAERRRIELSATAELGFLRPVYHTIQIGQDGYRFDYVEEGGQEILFPYTRFEVEALIARSHEVSLLYQPLTLQTEMRVDSAGGILIDDVTFADDTPLDLTYGFDFYRATYRYRFRESDRWKLSAGGALQIRNASIRFDGYDASGNEVRVVTQDLGPVPVLSFAARTDRPGNFFLEATIDGFYAPIRYLNFSDSDVIGWLYDVAFRVGIPVHPHLESYISFRMLGGGADGSGDDPQRWTESREAYSYNNLNIAVLSIGARLR